MDLEQTEKISIPVSVFNSMVKAQKSWEDFIDEFEDFLYSRDKSFLERMRKARQEHLSGELSSFSELKRS